MNDNFENFNMITENFHKEGLYRLFSKYLVSIENVVTLANCS